jgi:hypothetical protein
MQPAKIKADEHFLHGSNKNKSATRAQSLQQDGEQVMMKTFNADGDGVR